MIHRTHSVERISPKGTPFIGTCFQCGAKGLRASAALEPCPNPLGLSLEDAVLRAINTEGE